MEHPELRAGAQTPRNLGYGLCMGHTIRRPALRVNITRQARDALEYLQEQGLTANAAVSQALIEKARESWDHNERTKDD